MPKIDSLFELYEFGMPPILIEHTESQEVTPIAELVSDKSDHDIIADNLFDDIMQPSQCLLPTIEAPNGKEIDLPMSTQVDLFMSEFSTIPLNEEVPSSIL